MSKYIFHCPCDLKHKISIDEHFIGKKMPIKISEYNGYVSFPIKSEGEKGGFRLISQKIDGLFGEYDCGNYSVTRYPDGKIICHPQISRVCICLTIDSDIQEDNKAHRQILEEVEKTSSKFIKCISLIHPSSIKWSYAKEEGYIEPIDSYSLVDTGTNEDYGIAAHINVEFRGVLHELTIAEFFQICRNINKDISLQHTLLADVKRYLARCEYREVVLNCATIIEITLKEQIEAYLDKQGTADDIKKYVLKSADGFSKILEIMKKFGIPTDNCGTIKQGTADIRNRVIHGRHFPTKEEADQAIKDAKLIMKQYNVPLFID